MMINKHYTLIMDTTNTKRKNNEIGINDNEIDNIMPVKKMNAGKILKNFNNHLKISNSFRELEKDRYPEGIVQKTLKIITSVINNKLDSQETTPSHNIYDCLKKNDELKRILIFRFNMEIKFYENSILKASNKDENILSLELIVGFFKKQIDIIKNELI